MRQLTEEEIKIICGGAWNGAVLGGVATIIDATSNFITSMAGLAFINQDHPYHQKVEFKFNKNMSFLWDDTKMPAGFFETVHLESGSEVSNADFVSDFPESFTLTHI